MEYGTNYGVRCIAHVLRQASPAIRTVATSRPQKSQKNNAPITGFESVKHFRQVRRRAMHV